MKQVFIFLDYRDNNRILTDIFRFLERRSRTESEFDLIRCFSAKGGFFSPLLSSSTVKMLESRGTLQFNVEENKIEHMRSDLRSMFFKELFSSKKDKFFLFLSHFSAMDDSDMEYLSSFSAFCKFKFIIPFISSLDALRLDFLFYRQAEHLDVFKLTMDNVNDYFLHGFYRSINSFFKKKDFFKKQDFHILNLDSQRFGEGSSLGYSISRETGIASIKEYNYNWADLSPAFNNVFDPLLVQSIKNKYQFAGSQQKLSVLNSAKTLIGENDLSALRFLQVSPFVFQQCRKFDQMMIEEFNLKLFSQTLWDQHESAFWRYSVF